MITFLFLFFFYLEAAFFHAATGFEVGADALAGALLELWELAAAGLDDGLDLLLGLLRDGHHAVQILIHKQTHKHLTDAMSKGEGKWREREKEKEGMWSRKNGERGSEVE